MANYQLLVWNGSFVLLIHSILVVVTNYWIVRFPFPPLFYDSHILVMIATHFCIGSVILLISSILVVVNTHFCTFYWLLHFIHFLHLHSSDLDIWNLKYGINIDVLRHMILGTPLPLTNQWSSGWDNIS